MRTSSPPAWAGPRAQSPRSGSGPQGGSNPLRPRLPREGRRGGAAEQRGGTSRRPSCRPRPPARARRPPVPSRRRSCPARPPRPRPSLRIISTCLSSWRRRTAWIPPSPTPRSCCKRVKCGASGGGAERSHRLRGREGEGSECRLPMDFYIHTWTWPKAVSRHLNAGRSWFKSLGSKLPFKSWLST